MPHRGKAAKTQAAVRPVGEPMLKLALEWMSRADVYSAMQLSSGLSAACKNPQLCAWVYYHAHVSAAFFQHMLATAYRIDNAPPPLADPENMPGLHSHLALIDDRATKTGDIAGRLALPQFRFLRELLITHPMFLPRGSVVAASGLTKLGLDFSDHIRRSMKPFLHASKQNKESAKAEVKKPRSAYIMFGTEKRPAITATARSQSPR